MISPPLPFKFLNQTLLLLPEKAIFWAEESTLIIADIHLGKVGHFRKAGIGIPKQMEQDDLALISDLIHEYKPAKIIFLGDLFHSDMNNDWDWLVLWRSMFKAIDMILVLGNHDILNKKFYTDLNFDLHEKLAIKPFLFSHEPLKVKDHNDELYVISGHIHPGVTLKGSARQLLTLPCFHFGTNQAIIPAFGKFTGKMCVKNVRGDQIFAVAKNTIISF
ncbi:ligase-associated DNA damage response endonuclease PdeM [Daejeonella sp.]|uniref:ligase-associated DNA damage response endonuclease PdeM n=1 Tax=Daejeonella sp. TaxID=2805397 RepID=UPI003983930E